MKTTKKESDNKSQKPSSSEFCNSRNMGSTAFIKTQVGKYALKKEFVDLMISTAKSLHEKVYIRLAWESGGRITELLTARKEGLKGNYITLINLKGHKVCLNCKMVKRSHTENKKGNCGKYDPDLTPEYKDIYVSDELVKMLWIHFNEIDGDLIFPLSDRTYKNWLKKHHKNITTHTLRRGLACWLLSKGASKDIIASTLGHRKTRDITLSHYLPAMQKESNEFLEKIYNGTDTRLVKDLSVQELKAILSRTIPIEQ